MKSSAIVRQALQDLRTYGFWKYSHFQDRQNIKTSPACSLGSLRRKFSSENMFYDSPRPAEWDTIIGTMQEIIQEQFPNRREPGLGVISQFNDHDDTTFEDVEKVFEKTIVVLEEQGL